MRIILAILLILYPNLSFSHSGNTNSDGCHNQYSNNTYHCHNEGDDRYAGIRAQVEEFGKERSHIDNQDFLCTQAPNGKAPEIINYATGKPTKSFLMQFWKDEHVILREHNNATYGRYTFGLKVKHKKTGFLGLSTIKGERGIFEYYNTEKFRWLESYDNQEYAMRWNNFTSGPSFLIGKDLSEQSITQTRGDTGMALFNCKRL